jgi:hypothetical protein
MAEVLSENQVIPIKGEDIVENMNYILENSNVFQTNSNMEMLKCYIFYYDGKKMLNFKKYEIDVHENKISKKELLAVVLRHNKVHHKSFDLTGIYKYELDLESAKIKDFCKDSEQFSFVTQYHNIQDITFHPCIEIFNENNALMLFFSRSNTTNDAAKQGAFTNKNRTQKKVKFNIKEQGNISNKTMKTL